MNTKHRFMTVALAAILLTSCTKTVAPSDPPFLKRHIGEACVVHFRGDALGAGGNSLIPPTTHNINGADVVQVGKLIAVEGEGLVIEVTSPVSNSYWIPYQVILSVSFTEKK
jgi:hypothetical protein